MRRKIVKFSNRDEADYYRVEILTSTWAIQEDLKRLYDLASYNAEMEDPFLRDMDAYDLTNNIKYNVEQIEINATKLMNLVR